MVVRLILQQPESHHDVRWWLMDPAPLVEQLPCSRGLARPSHQPDRYQTATFFTPQQGLMVCRMGSRWTFCSGGMCLVFEDANPKTGMAQQALFNVAQVSHDH